MLWILALAVITGLALVGCAGESELIAGADVASEPENQVVGQVETSISEGAQLAEDYTDALSIEGQLALGTLQLEETDKAVDEVQATELLTLWQAYRSLSNSDTAASLEVEAVLRQIQDTMTGDQIAAIAEMRLTSDSITALIEEGGLATGRGGFGNRGAGDDGGPDGASSGGFLQGGIPGQVPGSGPGGGLPGSGPGAGGSGNISEDDIATRQAQFAEGDFGGFQERLLTGAVIGLLQNKTGELPEPAGIFATIYDIIAEETGLTSEEIQGQIADGVSLAEIIENNGADNDAILTKLTDALSDSDQIRGQDMEEFLSNLLN
jgi:hypothetical protein